MYPQRASIPLQGVGRRVLTVGVISGPHSKIGALLWGHFTSRGFTWSAKTTLEKADQLTLASEGSRHAYVAIYLV